MELFLRRVRSQSRKRGLPAPRFIAVTEWREEGDGLPAVRVHHHVVLSCGLSRDELEGLWYRGASAGPRQAEPDGAASTLPPAGAATGRPVLRSKMEPNGDKGRGKDKERLGITNADRLQFDRESLERLANYLTKYTNRKRRWRQSRGLEKPQRPRPNDGKYTRRQLERLVTSGTVFDSEFWRRKYQGWEINDITPNGNIIYQKKDAANAIKTDTGYQLPNTVDAAQQLISGEGVDFTTQRKGAVQATASLAENVAQELPFVGGVLGGGRVPISSALPDMGNLVSNAVGLASGEKDAGRAMQGIGKELAKPAFYILPPLGGGQLKKAFEGITTVANGGQFGYDSQGRETMKFPVENPTLGTYAQAALFGPYSLPMAQDYVDSGFRAKSAKYTEAYRAATGAGVEGEKFRAMMDAMDADGNGTLSAGEVTQGLEGHGLTPEQKAAVWQVYASDEAKAKYKAAQAVGAGEQYILMLPMLDADKSGSVSTDELYAAMDSQGLDAGQQAALWYAYAGSGQRMKYEKAEEYGLGRIYAEMLRYADTNNSGTLNKDELRAYLDSTGLNRAQKAVLFELASTAKNPYE